jgi:anti-sigma factor RsiW
MFMNCERCKNELEDFLYCELGQTRSSEIREHLARCAACAAARDDLKRENDIFAQFYEQTAIEPNSEVWAAIRARISEEPLFQPKVEKQIGWLDRLREGSFGWLLAPAILRQVAFAVLLIALSVAATTLYLRRDGSSNENIADRGPKVTPTPAPQQIETPVPSPSTGLANLEPKRAGNSTSPKTVQPAPRITRQLTEQELVNRQIARTEREYEKAIRMLDQAIAKRRGDLDPQLIKQYESSLALIDDSIAASRRALRQRPDDLAAGQFLLAAYAKKIELMQDFAMK